MMMYKHILTNPLSAPFSHFSFLDLAVLHPLLLLWKAKIPGVQSAASTPDLTLSQRTRQLQPNQRILYTLYDLP